MRSDLAFDCTAENSREPCVAPSRDRRKSRFARLCPGAIGVTEATPGSTKPASHEVWHPSDDFTVGVRLTWAYHTQHLPPLSFLSPSTVCSSTRLACLVSYRRHLWGSKNRSGPTGQRPRSWQVTVRRPLPAGSRNTRTAQTTGVDCDRATGSSCHRSILSAELFLERPASSRHSPRSLRTGSKGGGRSDKLHRVRAQPLRENTSSSRRSHRPASGNPARQSSPKTQLLRHSHHPCVSRPAGAGLMTETDFRRGQPR